MNQSITAPQEPGDWDIKQIETVLSRPLPSSILKTLEDKGNVQYIPWYSVCSILSKYCPGWQWEIRSTYLSSDRIFIVGRLSLPTRKGIVFREATGTEELKQVRYDKITKQYSLKEIAYGDPSSNAESMAFRRCASKFGLGLSLYGS